MHYLYRYVCILNVFFYMCIWTIVCNKEFIIIIIILQTYIKIKHVSTIKQKLQSLQNILSGLPKILHRKQQINVLR